MLLHRQLLLPWRAWADMCRIEQLANTLRLKPATEGSCGTEVKNSVASLPLFPSSLVCTTRGEIVFSCAAQTNSGEVASTAVRIRLWFSESYSR